jgi:hypothetical protein
MFSLVVLLLIIVVVILLFLSGSEEPLARRKQADEQDNADWEYGDVWKQGSPDQQLPENNVQYVEILRGDTGMGYDDSVLIDLIGYLSSRGIRATYDAVPLAMEFGVGAIKTYVLKVEAGKEDEAKTYLTEKE